jgi:hypothetical protein
VTAAIDPAVFERFIPLNKLSAKGREALIMGKGISQVSVPREVYLFKAGQSVYDTLYVLEGKVELLTPPPDERVQGSVTGGSPECLQPMPNQVPSQISAVAATDVRTRLGPAGAGRRDGRRRDSPGQCRSSRKQRLDEQFPVHPRFPARAAGKPAERIHEDGFHRREYG